MTRRGTTNTNDRGSAEDRRKRREWLVENWRSDIDLLVVDYDNGQRTWAEFPAGSLAWEGLAGPEAAPEVLFRDGSRGKPVSVKVEKTCRCVRGKLLTVDYVTCDRFPVRGEDGGTYRRENIRPMCGSCNSKDVGRGVRKGGSKGLRKATKGRSKSTTVGGRVEGLEGGPEGDYGPKVEVDADLGCKCDGARYRRPGATPFLIHSECPVHAG